jgi:phage gp36-like protein
MRIVNILGRFRFLEERKHPIMYATAEDISLRLDQRTLLDLTDDDGDDAADSTVLEAVLTDADGVIDSYLSSRYATPLSPVPTLLCKLAADLAIAALFARRRETISSEHATRAEQALVVLRSLAEGEMVLCGTDQVPKNVPRSTTQNQPGVFDDREMTWY